MAVACLFVESADHFIRHLFLACPSYNTLSLCACYLDSLAELESWSLYFVICS
jgi:hypothetical protein